MSMVPYLRHCFVSLSFFLAKASLGVTASRLDAILELQISLVLSIRGLKSRRRQGTVIQLASLMASTPVPGTVGLQPSFTFPLVYDKMYLDIQNGGVLAI